jgi:predicted TIM-barrel enzyme
VLVTEVRRATSMHVGVNILRNACTEALSIAQSAAPTSSAATS